MELAISTLVLIVIGLMLLIALIYAATIGFDKFRGTSKPFIDTANAGAVKQACSIACKQEDRLTFCCKNYTLEKETVKCDDNRLEVGCSLSCNGFSC